MFFVSLMQHALIVLVRRPGHRELGNPATAFRDRGEDLLASTSCDEPLVMRSTGLSYATRL
jgi:hypothetical protein